jgi:hypothetical protein
LQSCRFLFTALLDLMKESTRGCAIQTINIRQTQPHCIAAFCCDENLTVYLLRRISARYQAKAGDQI